LKPRFLIPGLVAIVALAVVVPAFGRGSGPAAPAASGGVPAANTAPAAHTKRHAPAPAKAKAKARHHRSATPDSSGWESFVDGHVAPVSAADVAELLATGSTDLEVNLSGPATVSHDGESAVGDGKETTTGTGPDGSEMQIQVPSEYAQVFAPSSVVADHAGTVDLPLTLNAEGKARLGRGETLEVVVSADAPGPGPILEMLVKIAG
jgi:hypothetical protein